MSDDVNSGEVNENGLNWWGQCIECGAEPHNHDYDSPHFGKHNEGCPMDKCFETVANCECGLDLDHEGPHECAWHRCGGSWTYDENGKFVVVSLPKMSIQQEWLLTMMLGNPTTLMMR